MLYASLHKSGSLRKKRGTSLEDESVEVSGDLPAEHPVGMGSPGNDCSEPHTAGEKANHQNSHPSIFGGCIPTKIGEQTVKPSADKAAAGT